MTSARRPPAGSNLYRRIDALPISAAEREHAKGQLRSAERFVDGVCGTLAALHALSAFIARHVRSALAPAPQH